MSEGSKSQQRTHWGVWTLDTNGEVAFNDVFIMNIDILTLNNIEGFIAFYSGRSRVWMTLKLHITYYTSIEMSVLGKRAVQEIGKQWKVYKKAFWPLVLYPHSVILSNIIPWSTMKLDYMQKDSWMEWISSEYMLIKNESKKVHLNLSTITTFMNPVWKINVWKKLQTIQIFMKSIVI